MQQEAYRNITAVCLCSISKHASTNHLPKLHSACGHWCRRVPGAADRRWNFTLRRAVLDGVVECRELDHHRGSQVLDFFRRTVALPQLVDLLHGTDCADVERGT